MFDGSRSEWILARAAIVGVRDSKDAQGLALVFTPGEWAAFTAGVNDGEFDRS
ncbi:DUF397 domain-containing protein [Nocardia sp. NPDC049737]